MGHGPRRGNLIFTPSIGKDNVVNIIEGKNNTYLGSFPIGLDPEYVVLGLDGKKLYVTAEIGKIFVFDTFTFNLITTIIIGDPIVDMIISPDGTRIYLTTFREISIVDTKTDTKIGRFPISRLGDTTISPDGRFLYAVSRTPFPPFGYLQDIAIIDIQQKSFIKYIQHSNSIKGLSGMDITPNGKFLYVTDSVNSIVRVYDVSVPSPLMNFSIDVGIQPSDIVIMSDGTKAYVVNKGNNENSGTVSVIDLATNKVIKTITVGGAPLYMTITSNNKTVYVSNTSLDPTTKLTSVSAVDTQIDAVIATIPLPLSLQARGITVGQVV